MILETGILREPDLITAAARAAVMAGVDFLKTSTGKSEVGATLEAAATLLAVCREADGRVGFKAAGGIRTAADAAAYLHLADAIMGPDWASPRTFRFGASSLLDDLLGRSGAPRRLLDAAATSRRRSSAPSATATSWRPRRSSSSSRGMTDGSIAEGQVAAFAMAVFFQGMTPGRDAWR